MADALVPAPFDPTVPAPGETTTEYAVTKITIVLTIVAAVVGGAIGLLQQLSVILPDNKSVGVMLSIAGVIGTVLTALGYQVTRAQVKVAAHNAAGNAVATQANADAAAAKLGAA